MRCPDLECNKTIGHDDIKKILSNKKNIISKYEKLIEQNKIEKDPLKFLCPNVKCKQYIRAKSLMDDSVECSKCTSKACFKCKLFYHRGKPCLKDMAPEDLI